MDIVGNVVRTADRAFGVVVATAGAAGGAVVNGVVGGVTGVATGVRDGIDNGRHSTPAAMLTLGLLGAAGVVEWPLLVGVGVTAVVLRQLRSSDQDAAEQSAAARPVKKSSPAKAASAKPKKATPAKRASATVGQPPRAAAARTRRSPTKS